MCRFPGSGIIPRWTKPINPTAEQVAAGHAVYTPGALRTYDLIVMGISNPLIWKCPTRHLLSHYNDHLSANHLDVGVGTGYFLDHGRFPTDKPRVGLLDMNANCLRAAALRIARYEPETYRANVLEPINIEADKFGSVGMNYVLHCLPGSMDEKVVALGYLSTLLNPGGVLFGSTLLQGGVKRGWTAKRLMSIYNRTRVFSNTKDDLVGLERALAQYFVTSSIRIVGCAALFVGRMR